MTVPRKRCAFAVADTFCFCGSSAFAGGTGCGRCWSDHTMRSEPKISDEAGRFGLVRFCGTPTTGIANNPSVTHNTVCRFIPISKSPRLPDLCQPDLSEDGPRFHRALALSEAGPVTRGNVGYF